MYTIKQPRKKSTRFKESLVMEFLYYCLIMLPVLSLPYSIHRPYDPTVPVIRASWEDEDRCWTLRESHLEEVIFTRFDESFFYDHLFPHDGEISSRHGDQVIDVPVLSELLEKLISQLNKCRLSQDAFEDFIILKKSDYNWQKASGLIIVKFKKYPFVAKIFCKTPETFVSPYDEGFVPACCFIVGGGVNRHLTGFTRIKNLEIIRQKIVADPYWSTIIDMPRKWYWLPEKVRWFIVESDNIGSDGYACMRLPSIYVIIADAIESDGCLRLWKKSNRKLALDVSNFLDSRLDPHIDNFVVEKDTGKIVIIDTEHFPSMVGLRKPCCLMSYCSYYFNLSIKYLRDKFCRSKRDRILAQRGGCDLRCLHIH